MGHYNPQPKYKYQTERFMAWLAERDKSILDPAVWSDYMREIELAYKKANTRHMHLASLKNAARAELGTQAATMNGDRVLALQQHLVNLRDYKSPKRNDVGKWLSDKECDYLIKAIQLPNWGLQDNLGRIPHPDIALMMEFLWNTGVRVSEMTGMLLSEITTVNGKCKIRYVAKGKKVNEAEVPSDLVERIKNYFNSKTFLFESSNGGKDKNNPEYRYSRTYVSQEIHRVGWTLLHRKISAHSFRYTKASEARAAFAEAHTMQMKLGHSNMGGTAHYAGGGE